MVEVRTAVWMDNVCNSVRDRKSDRWTWGEECTCVDGRAVGFRVRVVFRPVALKPGLTAANSSSCRLPYKMRVDLAASRDKIVCQAQSGEASIDRLAVPGAAGH